MTADNHRAAGSADTLVLAEAAEAFRKAMLESGALNHVKQDTYFSQLRALETAIAVTQRLRKSPGSGWQPIDNKPEPGRKIVALYNDGSGARLFFTHDGGFIDSDGDDYPELDQDSYSFWAYLPSGFAFWCEDRADDPVRITSGQPQEGQR